MGINATGIGAFPRAATKGSRPAPEVEYAFCETLAAHRIHIRPLTSMGRKVTGGADTASLCGLNVLWDLRQWVLADPRLCPKCVEVWRAKTAAKPTA